MTNVWECDGCGHRGSEDEINDHILKVNTDENGDFIPVPQIKCWGAMCVGGPSWSNFHEKGAHPMTMVWGMIDKVLMDNPQYWPLFQE